MPRQARIDAPGALHHIIMRGNERRDIFQDDHDRDSFLERLSSLLIETETPCFAWCLMPNHTHLLLRTGFVPLAIIMRRLLTGYAQQFNRRHGRYGHLFQNRYKSILCEEDPYLLTLVQYIHLNPVRAKLIKDVNKLKTYRYTGHSCLNGNHDYPWQDKQYVLQMFSKNRNHALRKYNVFVSDGIDLGKRPELTGGGLIRSMGGWAEVKASRAKGDSVKGDERILGSSEFVEQVLKSADEQMNKSAEYKKKGLTIKKLISRTADYLQIAEEDLKTNSKAAEIVTARSLVCYLAVRELEISSTETAVSFLLSRLSLKGVIIMNKKKLEPANPGDRYRWEGEDIFYPLDLWVK